jgi:hypothetical protein
LDGSEEKFARDEERVHRARDRLRGRLRPRCFCRSYCGVAAGAAAGFWHFHETLPALLVTCVGTLGALQWSEAGGVAGVSVAAGMVLEPPVVASAA